jgi:hypothetical protein
MTFLLIALFVYVPYSLMVAFVLPVPAAAAPAVPGTVPQFDREATLLRCSELVLFGLIVLPLGGAALTHSISAAFLGKQLSAGESYRRAAPRLAGLIGTQILAWLAPFLGLILLRILFGNGLFGIGVLIMAAIVVSCWLYVLTPIVVLERVTGVAAMNRSLELMRDNIGKAFLIELLTAIVAGAIGGGLGFVIGLIPWPYQPMHVLVENLTQAVLLPIAIAPATLLYYDLRIRKEAFDLQMLSSATMLGWAGTALGAG